MAGTCHEWSGPIASGWVPTHLVRRDGVWYPDATASEKLSYPDTVRTALAAIEEGSFWFSHRNRAIADLATAMQVREPIWEIGAGNGSVSHHLQRCGFEVVAVEPSATGAALAHDRGVELVIAGRLDELRLPTGSLGAVGLFDVLEHLEAPHEMLAEVARIMAPRAKLLITVPAHAWLWSHADVEAGHYRRYTKQLLDETVLRHGFVQRDRRHLFHSLVPAVLFGRTLRSRRPADDPGSNVDAQLEQLRSRRRSLARLATAVLNAERALNRLVPLPFGTSLIAAYERDDSPHAESAQRGEPHSHERS